MSFERLPLVTQAEADALNVVAGQAEALKALVPDANGQIIWVSGQHATFLVKATSTDWAGKTIRLGSGNNTGTANSLIGFQSKPAQAAATAQNVIGCEISPRVNDTFALTGSGSLIGAHVDAYLKGTTGNIAGDVRGMNVELVTDDAGARTITGAVSGIRIRSAFSATGITGNFCPFRVEKAEAQTNSQNYDALFELTSNSPGVWNSDPATELNLPGGTVKGYIKVIVNGAARYIALYEIGNLAD